MDRRDLRGRPFVGAKLVGRERAAVDRVLVGVVGHRDEHGVVRSDQLDDEADADDNSVSSGPAHEERGVVQGELAGV